ncbi:N-acetylmuramoyl-L-alanine amidase [Candidatus Nomurabacteria bacterium]|nr:N-acetylmuramoyl-L-alanine amidase [Candidatus Nomurabacteria bacterium]MCB9820426.1 N-acetylmuramoyl-L-alanine amidase [Candidatus Nomurabacteria bacterium]
MKKLIFFLALVFVAQEVWSNGYPTEVAYDNGLTVKYNLANQQDTLCWRDTTMYIILHTTEGSWPATTEWLKRGPWGHYVVNRRGLVEIIVEDERYTGHAGHSMWNGDTAISRFSISIELEQYHNSLTPVQLISTKLLIEILQEKYHIPDDHVLIHPAVACFYPEDRGSDGVYRRGRKHDAIEFASNDWRAKVGLGPGPEYDPDVISGAMKPDKKLERILYGKNFSEADIEEIRNSILAKRRQNPTNSLEYVVVKEIAVAEPEIITTPVYVQTSSDRKSIDQILKLYAILQKNNLYPRL